MHYYIDGYNMLFRGNQSFKQLQAERELLLDELNQKAFLLNLNVSVIFDAAFQVGGRTRTHFNALEVIYTAEGETADQYLVEMMDQISNPRRLTVVTNDKILASHLRHFSVKIETVEYFTGWLNRSYAKRLKAPQKKTMQPVISATAKTSLPPAPLNEAELIPKKTGETELDFYLRIFEAEYEILKKSEKTKKPLPKKTRRPKVVLDPFDSPRVVKSAENEMQRWLKAFEEGLHES